MNRILFSAFAVLFILSGIFSCFEKAEAADRLCELVKRIGNDYDTYRFGEDYDNMGISKVRSEADMKQSVIRSMEEMGKAVGYNYQIFEPIMIDGVPWQESKYADIIIDGLDKDPTSLFKKYPDLYYFIKDKRFNGMGAKIVPLVKQGKSIEEISNLLLSNNEYIPDKEYNPEEKKEFLDVQEQNNINDTTINDIDNNLKEINITLNQVEYNIKRDNYYSGGSLEMMPIMEGQVTMVPLKEIVEVLGGEVEWIEDKNQVKVTKNNKEILLYIGQTKIFIDGTEKEINMAPKVIRNRTYVPLRFLSESMGFQVTWNNDAKSINIK